MDRKNLTRTWRGPDLQIGANPPLCGAERETAPRLSAGDKRELDECLGLSVKGLRDFMAADKAKPLVGILMGSKSDWAIMQHCAAQLEELDVPWEAQAISAHRAPDALSEYLSTVVERGLEVIIAAAGGAAHLPGVCAAKTALPVLGVPMESQALKGLDSLLSIVQMPGGVPVGTLAIGKSGAINAALLAVAILGVKYPGYRQAYHEFRKRQTAAVLSDRILSLPEALARND